MKPYKSYINDIIDINDNIDINDINQKVVNQEVINVIINVIQKGNSTRLMSLMSLLQDI